MGRSYDEWIARGSISEELAEMRGFTELIRCRNCQNYVPCRKNVFNIQGICMRMNQPTNNDYYCADGVKRE